MMHTLKLAINNNEIFDCSQSILLGWTESGLTQINSPPNQPNQLQTEWTHMVGHCLSYALYLVVNKCLFPLTSYVRDST